MYYSLQYYICKNAEVIFEKYFILHEHNLFESINSTVYMRIADIRVFGLFSSSLSYLPTPPLGQDMT